MDKLIIRVLLFSLARTDNRTDKRQNDFDPADHSCAAKSDHFCAAKSDHFCAAKSDPC